MHAWRESFDVLPGRHQGPFIWRLSAQEKRKLGVQWRSISPYTKRLEHWLAFGDLWMSLVFAGLRPKVWETERKDIGGFDIFMTIKDSSYLVEVQLSKLERKAWEQRWDERLGWYRKRKWEEKEWANQYCSHSPKVLVISAQKEIYAPSKTIHVYHVNDVAKMMLSLHSHFKPTSK